MIETNVDHNRRIMNTHVMHLAQQMQDGQWRQNGEPIIFSRDGQLIDGQHRLKAVIMSGVTIKSLVVSGVAETAFATINRGKSRSNGSLFQIEGVPNANDIAAAVKGVLDYRHAISLNGGEGGSLNSCIRPSGIDLLDEYGKHDCDYSFAVKIALRCRKICTPSVVSTVAALALIEAKRSEDEVMLFWDNFIDGVGLSAGDPILTLRNKFNENERSRAKLSRVLLVVGCIKAWNCYVTGKEMRIIRVLNGEPCPRIM